MGIGGGWFLRGGPKDWTGLVGGRWVEKAGERSGVDDSGAFVGEILAQAGPMNKRKTAEICGGGNCASVAMDTGMFATHPMRWRSFFCVCFSVFACSPRVRSCSTASPPPPHALTVAATHPHPPPPQRAHLRHALARRVFPFFVYTQGGRHQEDTRHSKVEQDGHLQPAPVSEQPSDRTQRMLVGVYAGTWPLLFLARLRGVTGGGGRGGGRYFSAQHNDADLRGLHCLESVIMEADVLSHGSGLRETSSSEDR